MKDKLPKLNSKEAEKLLFENGFILDRHDQTITATAEETIQSTLSWLTGLFG